MSGHLEAVWRDQNVQTSSLTSPLASQKEPILETPPRDYINMGKERSAFCLVIERDLQLSSV